MRKFDVYLPSIYDHSPVNKVNLSSIDYAKNTVS